MCVRALEKHRSFRSINSCARTSTRSLDRLKLMVAETESIAVGGEMTNTRSIQFTVSKIIYHAHIEWKWSAKPSETSRNLSNVPFSLPERKHLIDHHPQEMEIFKYQIKINRHKSGHREFCIANQSISTHSFSAFVRRMLFVLSVQRICVPIHAQYILNDACLHCNFTLK